VSKNPHTKRSHWRGPDGNDYPIMDAAPGTILMIQPTKADIKVRRLTRA